MSSISCHALLLDMDGVLADSTPAVARVWTRWAQKHNIDADYAVHLAHGRTSLTSIRELLPHLDSEGHHAENRWMEQAEIEEIQDVIALPGAEKLLKTVPSSQFAVVTSSTKALAEVRLRTTQLWPYVAHLITASDIKKGKPDPEPYLKGAASLNIDPRDCVVIEDAPFGVRSGKAAGCRVIGLRTTMDDNSLSEAGVDWIINDLSSLRISTSPQHSQLALEFPADEIPARPKIR